VLAAYLSALCEHQRNIAAHNTLKAEADKVGRRYLRASRELRETHDILQGIGQALPPMTRDEDPIPKHGRFRRAKIRTALASIERRLFARVQTFRRRLCDWPGDGALGGTGCSTTLTPTSTT
jgi:hypothetical protein